MITATAPKAPEVLTQRQINLGTGEIMISSDHSVVLSCPGLGSSIAVCAYDPVVKVGGVAVMQLPACKNNDISGSISRYVDTGVPLLINKMLKYGAAKNTLIVKIAGGAKILSIPGENIPDIGQMNIDAAKAALKREKIPLCGANLGGTCGRMLHFYLDTGRITLKTVNGPSTEL
jgi:chemotaxis protein CheD